MNRLLVALLIILVVITKSRDRPQLALDPLLQLLALLLQPLEVLLQARCLLRTYVENLEGKLNKKQAQKLVQVDALDLSL